MYFFYILKSCQDGELYFGYSDNLKKRLEQHNSGKVVSTKPRKPLVLVYYEAYYSKRDAIQREHNIKLRGNAYLQLKRRLKNCVVEAK